MSKVQKIKDGDIVTAKPGIYANSVEWALSFGRPGWEAWAKGPTGPMDRKFKIELGRRYQVVRVRVPAFTQFGIETNGMQLLLDVASGTEFWVRPGQFELAK